jgi:hypothetical protein
VYSEDFETLHGWVKLTDNAQDQNSWTDAIVSPGEFPEDAASGTRAWYTDRPDVAVEEISWVLSPCFDLSGFDRPMVSLAIKRSLDYNEDGAVLQYTIDNQATWNNVGDVNDGGINWYNSDRVIKEIDNTKTGWTGDIIPGEDDEWNEAAHGVDEVAGESQVRFRVVYGTLGDPPRTPTNDGFAFDDFSIRQRNRLSVLEYFSNANTPKCAETDSLIMGIMNQAAADVIDIQYHAAGSQADQFYQDNPVPANSRGTVYGVTGIPYAVLDGKIETYDFNPDDANVEDIRMRSLMDPDFKLSIIVSQYTPSLEFSVEIEALRNLSSSDRTLHAIVLERRISEPEYHGTNGLTVFRHVARKMLPDAAGTYLGSKAWGKGDKDEVDLIWETPFSFFETIQDSITIAVFIQDDESLEILQAATNPMYATSILDEEITPSKVLIYPNPAREHVTVYFEDLPGEDMNLSLYDLSGKMVIHDVIESWQQQFTLSLGDLEQGMYIVEIRSRDRRRVLHRDKLLHY